MKTNGERPSLTYYPFPSHWEVTHTVILCGVLPIHMTGEKRADGMACPECDNNPIVRDDGMYFCDICNEEYARGELMRAV